MTCAGMNANARRDGWREKDMLAAWFRGER